MRISVFPAALFWEPFFCVCEQGSDAALGSCGARHSGEPGQYMQSLLRAAFAGARVSSDFVVFPGLDDTHTHHVCRGG